MLFDFVLFLVFICLINLSCSLPWILCVKLVICAWDNHKLVSYFGCLGPLHNCLGCHIPYCHLHGSRMKGYSKKSYSSCSGLFAIVAYCIYDWCLAQNNLQYVSAKKEKRDRNFSEICQNWKPLSYYYKTHITRLYSSTVEFWNIQQ